MKNLQESSITVLTDKLKIEINSKDVGTTRGYKLTVNSKLEMFEDFLTSELKIRKLYYVLDNKNKNVIDTSKFEQDELKEI